MPAHYGETAVSGFQRAGFRDLKNSRLLRGVLFLQVASS